MGLRVVGPDDKETVRCYNGRVSYVEIKIKLNFQDACSKQKRPESPVLPGRFVACWETIW